MIEPNVSKHNQIRKKAKIQHVFKDIYEAILYFLEQQN